jgi:hypothetical protein
MLGLPKSSPAAVPRSPVARLALMALLVAGLLYVVVFWQPAPRFDPTELNESPVVEVITPKLDAAILASARDGSREERLFLEPEPLRHLLERSLNVSPETSQALGVPAAPVPLADLRARPGDYRGRWLFYKGVVEDLAGPRPGHPVANYAIYEATLRLPDGELALFTFSHPPGPGVRPGAMARAEGFLLKLRDLTFPTEVRSAPLLVGSRLQRDFEDWGPVRELEPDRFASIIDTRRDGDHHETTKDAWRAIDDDQAEPLWHLGAYARDRAEAPLAVWRQVTPLNSQETWEQFKRNAVERGTPMRVLGTLVKSRAIVALPNPAGIHKWTEAWVQVSDLGGKTVPVWVPKETQVPLGTALEVRGYYFRRFAYESRRGQMYWTPLFVAADLDPFEMRTGAAMREVSWIALIGFGVLLLLAFWNRRVEQRRSAEHEAALGERRRRRRLKATDAAAGTAGAP